MPEPKPMNIQSESYQYRPRDLRVLEELIANGKSLTMTVGVNQVEDIVGLIRNQLVQSEAAQPVVISLDSPTIEADIAKLVDVVMNSTGSPKEEKMQHPEYYIWVNADLILDSGLAPELKRISKYSRCVFIFDHTYEFAQLHPDLQYALGAECDRDVFFDPIQ